jgi:hypothetical protein
MVGTVLIVILVFVGLGIMGFKPILAKTHNAHAHFLDYFGPIRIHDLFESTEKNVREKNSFRTFDEMCGMVSFLRTFFLRKCQYQKRLYLVCAGKAHPDQ